MFSDYAAVYLLAMQGQPFGAPPPWQSGHPGFDMALICLVLGLLGAVGTGVAAG